MRNFFVSLIVPALVCGSLSVANAQNVGEAEYLEACATCHGVSGGGDGPMAEFMSTRVPDLRGLSAGNDGEFPMLDVVATIDGRSEVGAHGREMPIWGERYSYSATSQRGETADMVARGRVLALALYLESIQQ